MKVFCFDLDDTLYKESDYLKSAYKEVVEYAFSHASIDRDFDLVYQAALDAYHCGGNAFAIINDMLELNVDLSVYLDIYRNHRLQITLPSEALSLLENLRSKKYIIGLITDGRSIQQRNKISALKLSEFISPDNIVISEEFGSEKPSARNYEYFMKKYPCAKEFVYVGDNVQKDFNAPNKLGWRTVCLLDNGRNIHKQDFTLPLEYQPQLVIKSLIELCEL